jgi:hypothetical protein
MSWLLLYKTYQETYLRNLEAENPQDIDGNDLAVVGHNAAHLGLSGPAPTMLDFVMKEAPRGSTFNSSVDAMFRARFGALPASLSETESKTFTHSLPHNPSLDREGGLLDVRSVDPKKSIEENLLALRIQEKNLLLQQWTGQWGEFRPPRGKWWEDTTPEFTRSLKASRLERSREKTKKNLIDMYSRVAYDVERVRIEK